MDKYGKTRKWFIKCITFDKVALEDKSVLAYAYILHDKDTSTPHFHIVIEFKDAKSRTAVIKFLKLDEHSTSDEWTTDGALRYLIHADQKDKYQYDIKDVIMRGFSIVRFQKDVLKPVSACEVYFLLRGRYNRTLEQFAQDSNTGKLINLVKQSNFRPGCFNIKAYAQITKNMSDKNNGVIKLDRDSPLFPFIKTLNVLKTMDYETRLNILNALQYDAESFIDIQRGITLSKLDSDTYK